MSVRLQLLMTASTSVLAVICGNPWDDFYVAYSVSDVYSQAIITTKHRILFTREYPFLDIIPSSSVSKWCDTLAPILYISYLVIRVNWVRPNYWLKSSAETITIYIQFILVNKKHVIRSRTNVSLLWASE